MARFDVFFSCRFAAGLTSLIYRLLPGVLQLSFLVIVRLIHTTILAMGCDIYKFRCRYGDVWVALASPPFYIVAANTVQIMPFTAVGEILRRKPQTASTAAIDGKPAMLTRARSVSAIINSTIDNPAACRGKPIPVVAR